MCGAISAKTSAASYAFESLFAIGGSLPRAVRVVAMSSDCIALRSGPLEDGSFGSAESWASELDESFCRAEWLVRVRVSKR